MATVHLTPIVRASAQKLFTIPTGLQYTTVTIYNESAASIFVGDSTCTTSGANKGLTIAANASLVLNMNANDSLWAIAASVTSAGEVVIIYSGI
jgi:hypothetical protein